MQQHKQQKKKGKKREPRKAYTYPIAGLSVVMMGFSPSFFRFLLMAATVCAAVVGELLPTPLLLPPLPFAPEAVGEPATVAAAAAATAVAAAEAVVIAGAAAAVTVAGVTAGASCRDCCILTVGAAPVPTVVSPTPPPVLFSSIVVVAVSGSGCGWVGWCASVPCWCCVCCCCPPFMVGCLSISRSRGRIIRRGRGV